MLGEFDKGQVCNTITYGVQYVQQEHSTSQSCHNLVRTPVMFRKSQKDWGTVPTKSLLLSSSSSVMIKDNEFRRENVRFTLQNDNK